MKRLPVNGLRRFVGRHGVCEHAGRGNTVLEFDHHPRNIVTPYLSASLLPRPTVVWVKLPDGAVLFAPETEVYYGMNVVATCIWELLPQASDSVDKLCSLVQERFPDAGLEQIRTDVVALLAELERAGLIETATESAA